MNREKLNATPRTLLVINNFIASFIHRNEQPSNLTPSLLFVGCFNCGYLSWWSYLLTILFSLQNEDDSDEEDAKLSKKAKVKFGKLDDLDSDDEDDDFSGSDEGDDDDMLPIEKAAKRLKKRKAEDE